MQIFHSLYFWMSHGRGLVRIIYFLYPTMKFWNPSMIKYWTFQITIGMAAKELCLVDKAVWVAKKAHRIPMSQGDWLRHPVPEMCMLKLCSQVKCFTLPQRNKWYPFVHLEERHLIHQGCYQFSVVLPILSHVTSVTPDISSCDAILLQWNSSFLVFAYPYSIFLG